jgi:hypothetical protein
MFPGSVQFGLEHAAFYTLLYGQIEPGRPWVITGPAQAMLEIGLSIPSAAHIRHYAAIVARNAAFRRLLGAAQAIAEDAWRALGDPDSAIARSIQRLVAIRRGLPEDLVSPATLVRAPRRGSATARVCGRDFDESRPCISFGSLEHPMPRAADSPNARGVKSAYTGRGTYPSQSTYPARAARQATRS